MKFTNNIPEIVQVGSGGAGVGAEGGIKVKKENRLNSRQQQSGIPYPPANQKGGAGTFLIPTSLPRAKGRAASSVCAAPKEVITLGSSEGEDDFEQNPEQQQQIHLQRQYEVNASPLSSPIEQQQQHDNFSIQDGGRGGGDFMMVMEDGMGVGGGGSGGGGGTFLPPSPTEGVDQLMHTHPTSMSDTMIQDYEGQGGNAPMADFDPALLFQEILSQFNEVSSCFQKISQSNHDFEEEISQAFADHSEKISANRALVAKEKADFLHSYTSSFNNSGSSGSGSGCYTDSFIASNSGASR